MHMHVVFAMIGKNLKLCTTCKRYIFTKNIQKDTMKHIFKYECLDILQRFWSKDPNTVHCMSLSNIVMEIKGLLFIHQILFPAKKRN
jgi:hypothetical protein